MCSGGLDSVVVCSVLQDKGHSLGLCFVRYGQRAQAQEERCVENLARYYSAVYYVVDAVGVFGTGSKILQSSGPISNNEDLAGQAAWVPARNLVLLSLGIVQAQLYDYRNVAIGNIAAGAYPDNQPAFTARFNDLLFHATGARPDQLSILAPINLLTKPQVVRLGEDFQAPFRYSWSCYTQGPVHCGKCASCKSRRAAFLEAKVADHVDYEK